MKKLLTAVAAVSMIAFAGTAMAAPIECADTNLTTDAKNLGQINKQLRDHPDNPGDINNVNQLARSGLVGDYTTDDGVGTVLSVLCGKSEKRNNINPD